jgi:hypothetical protein
VIWKLTPVSLTGSEGTTLPVTVDRTFDQFATLVGPNQYYCQFEAVTGNLRTGTWRVEVSTGGWIASCQVTLTASLVNPVHFTNYAPGCVNGFGWP